jgi:hypothetical protein
MDVIVAEEVPYLTDGGRQRMPRGSREHHLGSGTHDSIHQSRIRTAGSVRETVDSASGSAFLSLM